MGMGWGGRPDGEKKSMSKKPFSSAMGKPGTAVYVNQRSLEGAGPEHS